MMVLLRVSRFPHEDNRSFVIAYASKLTSRSRIEGSEKMGGNNRITLFQ